MNNTRRKAIKTAIFKLEAIAFRAERGLSWDHFAADAKDLVEGALSDEQESFDSMPEALQASDNGQRSETALISLEGALDSLTLPVSLDDVADAISELESAVEL